MVTGFFWDEATFWHSAGNYADILPVVYQSHRNALTVANAHLLQSQSCLGL
jgi:hypothetical protein